jgi:hypothetical protein
MYADRQALYKRIQAKRRSQVIALVTGDRPGQETQIAKDMVDIVGPLLDKLRQPKKISLLLYTVGGEIIAAWSLVKLLREFCDDLEVILPSKCYSAGTLICLGADRVVMAKQSCLGPIDPSINGPLNPKVIGPTGEQSLPLSVEDVAGYMELAISEGRVPESGLANVFLKLASDVHPLALGRVKRARKQIQDLAEKLLVRHMHDRELREKIIKVLCLEAGSHDYAIYRTEARELGLNIETPSMELYKNMRDVLADVRAELQLGTPFNLAALTGVAQQPVSYQSTRVLIETAGNGAHHWITRGVVSPGLNPAGQQTLSHVVQSDGWENAP